MSTYTFIYISYHDQIQKLEIFIHTIHIPSTPQGSWGATTQIHNYGVEGDAGAYIFDNQNILKKNIIKFL